MKMVYAEVVALLRSHIRGMLMSVIVVAAIQPFAAQPRGAQTAALPGHVLGILPEATPLARDPQRNNDLITLEVVLKPSDQQGLSAFLKDLEDPSSPNYHAPLQPSDVTARFGPTQDTYDKVLDYFTQQGFKLVIGSNNRRTITVRGTRAQAEKALSVAIDDYRLGARNFYAIAGNPSLPVEIAPQIVGISGLSNLAHWQPYNSPSPAQPVSIATAYQGNVTPAGTTNSGGLPPGLDGAGQTVAIITFYDFDLEDIKSWLKLADLPASLIDNVSKAYFDGGPGPAVSPEPLLDVATVLGFAPGARVIAFGVPRDTADIATPHLTAVNYAIDTIGVGAVITDSYGVCEEEISVSDANNLDSVLQTAAASGITMFAATGDTGSTCTDLHTGMTFDNSISFPSDVPHVIAAGGTSLHVNSKNQYQSESWWDNSIGAGGYGSSILTTEFSYAASADLPRTVPDVVIDADPNTGFYLSNTPCGASSSNPCKIGGTSMAAPMWASIWSLVNQANADAGRSPFSATDYYFQSIPQAFHSPSSMTGLGNDSTHLGFGSPDVASLVAIAGAPVEITGISPDFGTALGSTPVTISGHGFIGVNQVTLDGAKAPTLIVFSDSKMVVQTPTAPAAEADIRVQTPAGTSAESSSDEFHYIPVLAQVNPNHGALTGGDTVTVTGYGLSAYHGFKYLFGDAPATGVRCYGAGMCTLTIPANSLGTVSLKISTPYGDSLNTLPFTYGAPKIISFSPAVGPTSGGLPITIHGSNLTSGMTLHFGGTVAPGVVCSGEATCTVNNPHVTNPESVSLTATVGGITTTPTAALFTFEVFPTLTAISQASAAAGTVVTLTGTAFSTTPGQTTFNFFGINVVGTCSSTTQCTATVPAEVDGTAHSTLVTVTVNGNTSLDSIEFSYPGKIVSPVPPCKGTKCQ
ncbi:MAG: IPT/TIG domain-containing protein [Terracidiphilus sp.]